MTDTDPSEATLVGLHSVGRYESTGECFGYFESEQAAKRFLSRHAFSSRAHNSGKLQSHHEDWFEIGPIDWQETDLNLKIVNLPFGHEQP